MQSFITLPDIKANSIMDKCIIDNFTSEVTKSFRYTKQNLDNCLSNLHEINSIINNTTLISNNIDNEYKVSKNYEENFNFAYNIDMSSTCEFDFENGICKSPTTSKSIFQFDSILINENVQNINKPDHHFFSTTISKDIVIECLYNQKTCINTITLCFTCENKIFYSIYTEDGILIDKGESNKTIKSSFSSINTNKVKIILSSEQSQNIFISYITGYRNTYGHYSEFISKEIKSYTSSNVKLNILSNTNNYKAYIGFIDKDDNIIWNDAKDNIYFNTSLTNSKVVQDGYPNFGEELNSYKKVYNINENTNKNSIKLLSGYGCWKYTLINNAFINNDMTVIEYTPINIIETKFIDTEDYAYNLTAGDLVILEQTIECNANSRVSIPCPTSVKVDEDYTIYFRYRITVNGDRYDTILSDKTIDIDLLKGKNKIQIMMNLKKVEETSDYKVIAYNFINFKKYASKIYTSKLEFSSPSFLKNDKNRECYSIIDDWIVIKDIIDGDKIYVEYENLIDSSIHYTDYLGQYLKLKIRVCLYNDNQDKFTSIKKLWI